MLVIEKSKGRIDMTLCLHLTKSTKGTGQKEEYHHAAGEV